MAAAAEMTHLKNIFFSIPNTSTCHLKKKLVKNNEKQGRYDQNKFVSKKTTNLSISLCKNVHKALKVYIALFTSTDKLFV